MEPVREGACPMFENPKDRVQFTNAEATSDLLPEIEIVNRDALGRAR